MRCVDKERIGLMGTMMFLGWTVAAIFIPRLSDMYGRKIIFLILLSCQSLIMLGLILSMSMVFSTFLLFMFGITITGGLPIGYIYLLELMNEKNAKIVGPCLNTSVGFDVVWATLSLQIIAKNTLVISLSSQVTSIFCVFCCFFLIPESPKFLYASK